MKYLSESNLIKFMLTSLKDYGNGKESKETQLEF